MDVWPQRILYAGAALGAGFVLSKRSASAEKRKLHVSAPGKVLVSGGYLVLERPNVGLIIGTTARFHCRIKGSGTGKGGNVRVHVICAQYIVPTLSYEITPAGEIVRGTDQPENPFVENAMKWVAQAHAELVRAGDERAAKFESLEIEMWGDSDFYSTGEGEGTAVAKTGLGSSAALTVCLTAALLAELGVISGEEKEYAGERRIEMAEDQLKMVHSLSQLAHCAAQGKIGSGFDVASSTFGTHQYVRFTPEVLKPLMDQEQGLSVLDFAKGSTLDSIHEPLSIPDQMQMVLGGVTGNGSDTRDMVRKLLAWKKSDKKAPALWNELASLSGVFAKTLNDLTQLTISKPKAYKAVVDMCCDSKLCIEAVPSVEQKDEQALLSLIQSLARTSNRRREILQEITKASEVLVEPPSQTTLLDATMKVPGVVSVGVPGAGGFDAVFALTLSKRASSAVCEVWKAWNKDGSSVRILDSRNDLDSGVCWNAELA